MSESVRKRSSWVGKKRTDGEKYIVDLDKDVFNLFEEKALNIKFMKRYAIMMSIVQG